MAKLRPTIAPDLGRRISKSMTKVATRARNDSGDVDQVIVIGIRTRNGRLQAFDGHTPGLDTDMLITILSALAEAHAQHGVMVLDGEGNASTFDLHPDGFKERNND